MGWGYYQWAPYVSVAERRANAERAMEKLRKQGHPVSPVKIEGRKIAQTFWGQAWCDNLERYSDFSNRLPRGRTYVRNGSVCDLQIAPGEVKAFVSGSEIYEVAVKVSPVPENHWTDICKDCAGAIDSLVELLKGRFSKGVMERVCRETTGLFPSPRQIKFDCSCPDSASMCKHVAAALYGVGARLDEKPELLFRLRLVDEKELIARASDGLPLATEGPAKEKVLAQEGLAEIFGLEMADPPSPSLARPDVGKATGDKRAKADAEKRSQRERKQRKQKIHTARKPKPAKRAGRRGRRERAERP